MYKYNNQLPRATAGYGPQAPTPNGSDKRIGISCESLQAVWLDTRNVKSQNDLPVLTVKINAQDFSHARDTSSWVLRNPRCWRDNCLRDRVGNRSRVQAVAAGLLPKREEGAYCPYCDRAVDAPRRTKAIQETALPKARFLICYHVTSLASAVNIFDHGFNTREGLNVDSGVWVAQWPEDTFLAGPRNAEAILVCRLDIGGYVVVDSHDKLPVDPDNRVYKVQKGVGIDTWVSYDSRRVIVDKLWTSDSQEFRQAEKLSKKKKAWFDMGDGDAAIGARKALKDADEYKGRNSGIAQYARQLAPDVQELEALQIQLRYGPTITPDPKSCLVRPQLNGDHGEVTGLDDIPHQPVENDMHVVTVANVAWVALLDEHWDVEEIVAHVFPDHAYIGMSPIAQSGGSELSFQFEVRHLSVSPQGVFIPAGQTEFTLIVRDTSWEPLCNDGTYNHYVIQHSASDMEYHFYCLNFDFFEAELLLCMEGLTDAQAVLAAMNGANGEATNTDDMSSDDDETVVHSSVALLLEKDSGIMSDSSSEDTSTTTTASTVPRVVDERVGPMAVLRRVAKAIKPKKEKQSELDSEKREDEEEEEEDAVTKNDDQLSEFFVLLHALVMETPCPDNTTWDEERNTKALNEVVKTLREKYPAPVDFRNTLYAAARDDMRGDPLERDGRTFLDTLLLRRSSNNVGNKDANSVLGYLRRMPQALEKALQVDEKNYRYVMMLRGLTSPKHYKECKGTWTVAIDAHEFDLPCHETGKMSTTYYHQMSRELMRLIVSNMPAMCRFQKVEVVFKSVPVRIVIRNLIATLIICVRKHLIGKVATKNGQIVVRAPLYHTHPDLQVFSKREKRVKRTEAMDDKSKLTQWVAMSSEGQSGDKTTKKTETQDPKVVTEVTTVEKGRPDEKKEKKSQKRGKWVKKGEESEDSQSLASAGPSSAQAARPRDVTTKILTTKLPKDNDIVRENTKGTKESHALFALPLCKKGIVEDVMIEEVGNKDVKKRGIKGAPNGNVLQYVEFADGRRLESVLLDWTPGDYSVCGHQLLFTVHHKMRGWVTLETQRRVANHDYSLFTMKRSWGEMIRAMRQKLNLAPYITQISINPGEVDVLEPSTLTIELPMVVKSDVAPIRAQFGRGDTSAVTTTAMSRLVLYLKDKDVPDPWTTAQVMCENWRVLSRMMEQRLKAESNLAESARKLRSVENGEGFIPPLL